MATIGTLNIDLVANTAKFTSTMSSAQKTMALVGQKMTSIGKTMSAAVTLPLAAIGVAAVKMASDAAESASKFNTVFGTSAGVMSEFISGLQTTVPATTKQLQDMSSGLQDLLVPMGVIPEKALEMNKQFISLAADLASFNNIPMEQAMEKIRAGLVGSSEPLLAFGVDVRQAAVELKALELGLISEGGEITNSIRAQAVLAIAMEQSTFAIGDAARTAESLANQFKFIKRDALELVQTIGNILIPIVTPMIEAIGNALTKFRDMDSSMQTVIVTVALIVAAIGPLLLGLGFIIPAIAALGPVIAVIFGPVGAIVAAVAIIVAFAATNETVQNTLKQVWDGIKANLDKVLKSIKRLFEAVSEKFTKLWDKWGESIEAIFKGLWNTVKGIIKPAFDLIKGVLSGALTVLSGLITTFTGLITGDWTTFTDGLKTIWTGLWTAIKAAITAPFAAIKNTVSAFTGAIEGFFSGLKTALVGGSIVPDMLSDIKTGFSGLSTDVAGSSGIVPGMMTDIGGAFGGLKTDVDGWFGATGTISGPITEGFSGMAEAVEGLIGENVLGALPGKISGLGSAIPGLTNLKNAFSGITTTVQGVANSITGIFDKVQETIDKVSEAINTAISAISSIVTSIPAFVGALIGSFVGSLLAGGNARGADLVEEHLRFIRISWFQNLIPFIEATGTWQGFMSNLVGINTIIADRALGLLGKMDTLIGIQRDRIAPAVESIDSKTPIQINNVINVTVSGGRGGQVTGPLPPMASKIGTRIGDQIIKVVKEGVTFNRGGLRTALQKI